MTLNLIWICVFTISIIMSSCSQEPPRLIQNLSDNDWELVYTIPGNGEKERYFAGNYPSEQAIPAKVPGDIHWDLMRAGELPDIYIGLNAQKTYKIPLKEWWYRKSFTVGQEWSGKNIRLHFAAIDYSAKVWINGEYLGNHMGQFTPFEFDVTDIIRINEQNTLSILIESAPENVIRKLFQLPRGQWQRHYAQEEVAATIDYWKSRTMTGWDWGTPLWTMGIWQDVTLLGTTDLFLDKLLIFPEIKAPYDTAYLTTRINVNSSILYKENIILEYKVECINAKAPTSSSTSIIKITKKEKVVEHSFPVPSPALWWPNGYGEQNLYSLTVTAKHKKSGKVLDQVKSNFGIRELNILENPDAKDYQKMMWYTHSPSFDSGEKEIPKDSLPKFLIEINGLPIFIHGGNWLPPDLIFGRPEKKEYEHLIRLAAMANYNVFRVWGGGIIEKQAFYDLCDQYGILVWQEMPHAGSKPIETDRILSITAKQQRKIMPLLISHPCIFRYGFGNEIYLSSRNSKQVAQFENICAEMDPARQVVGPSPVVEYQRHGPHWFYIPGEYGVYNSGYPLTAGADNPVEWSEYGASGASSIETLKKIIPDKDLWPIPYNDSALQWHNATGAYTPTDWLKPEIYKSLFGELSDLETEIRVSQFVQAEGLRYANQSHRRAKWHRSGCYMWTFNEPWPNVAHGSIVEYYGSPKMAFFAVKDSYSKVDISVKYNSISLHPKDTLMLPVFVTNAGFSPIKGARLKTQIIDLGGNPYHEDNKIVQVNANSSHIIDSLSFIIPQEANNNVLLVRFDFFDDAGENVSSQTYTFGVDNSSQDNVQKEYFRPMLHAPKAHLTTSVDYGKKIKWGNDDLFLYGATVKNRSKVPALYVQLESAYKPQEIYFKDNYFILFPEEERTVEIIILKNKEGRLKDNDISVKAWNSN